MTSNGTTDETIKQAHPSAPNGLRYGTILADPPWDIHQRGTYGAIRHYPLMSVEAICNLRVNRLASRPTCCSA